MAACLPPLSLPSASRDALMLICWKSLPGKNIRMFCMYRLRKLEQEQRRGWKGRTMTSCCYRTH